MIHVFRLALPLIGLYILYLTVFHFTAGMLPVWIGLMGFSAFMSFEKTFTWFMSKSILKGGLIIGIMTLVIVEGMIIYAGFKEVSNQEQDYLIILGAKVNGENMSVSLRKRAEKGLAYLEEHPQTVAVLSGGQGPDEGISEAEAMRRYLTGKGIEESRLILEDASTSTIENIDFSMEKILSHHETSGSNRMKVAVVTNRFHILRAQMIGWKKGYDFGGLGAESFPLLLPNYYLREFFGVIYMVFQSY